MLNGSLLKGEKIKLLKIEMCAILNFKVNLPVIKDKTNGPVISGNVLQVNRYRKSQIFQRNFISKFNVLLSIDESKKNR